MSRRFKPATGSRDCGIGALKRQHLLKLILVWDVTNVIRFPFILEKTT